MNKKVNEHIEQQKFSDVKEERKIGRIDVVVLSTKGIHNSE